MTCPCGSGNPTLRTATGTAYCRACQRPKRMHGRMTLRDVESSREFVTRQARARAEIEARRDMEVGNA